MAENRDRLGRGEWYLDDPDLQQSRRACWRLQDRFNVLGADEDVERSQILEAMLGEVGDGAVVMPRFQCSYGTHISFGSGSFVNSNAFFMDDAPIHVGAHARIGPGAQLMTATHPIADHERRRQGWERAEPIHIGDNAWLGAGVIVCPGVRIGANAIVGAGSVVIRDVPERTLVAGSPADTIRHIDAGA